MKLIIKDSGKPEKTIDYTKLSLKNIEQQILRYERQHGSFEIFAKQYDCDEGNTDLYTQLLDWENLLAEKRRRKSK
jgi:hypothetical protein